jgi:GT2 family glycosyltransferase
LSTQAQYWRGEIQHISGQGNVGYGRGHNLAIAQAHSQYHLVLNPDVELAADALVQALAFMDGHPACGLLAPSVLDERDELQYLCKRYPSVLDLALRGFAPGWLKVRFHHRLARYEMRDLVNDRDLVWDPPIVSGCFMLFRSTVLQALSGFDPQYFLYFEDFDLSLRAGRLARSVYAPQVRIMHRGGGAARKGPAHVRMFVTSALRFFRQHGWRYA